MLSSALSKSNFPVSHVLEIASSLRPLTESVHLCDQKVREQRALVDYATGKWSPRPDRAVWVRDLIRECKEAGLAVFFKQRLVQRGMWEPIYVPAASASL
jgi:hypothetical protein